MGTGLWPPNGVIDKVRRHRRTLLTNSRLGRRLRRYSISSIIMVHSVQKQARSPGGRRGYGIIDAQSEPPLMFVGSKVGRNR